jgi:hypothetical protein
MTRESPLANLPGFEVVVGDQAYTPGCPQVFHTLKSFISLDMRPILMCKISKKLSELSGPE